MTVLVKYSISQSCLLAKMMGTQLLKIIKKCLKCLKYNFGAALTLALVSKCQLVNIYNVAGIGGGGGGKIPAM